MPRIKGAYALGKAMLAGVGALGETLDIKRDKDEALLARTPENTTRVLRWTLASLRDADFIRLWITLSSACEQTPIPDKVNS